MLDNLANSESRDVITFVVVFGGVMLLLVPSIFKSKSKRRYPQRSYQFKPNMPTVRPMPFAGSNDAAEQLRAVMQGSFFAKHVLSKTEAKVMRAAEAAIAEAGLPWRVMAQVALGEVLASPDEAAFRAINAKRVDLLVVSAMSEPLAAIEYQGQGHYQGSAPARDAIKKEALRKAGVRYIEITFEHGPDDVKREIDRMVLLSKLQKGSSRPPITAVS